MNVYPILESELDSMGMLSLQVEGSLTLAGVFASAWFTLGLERRGTSLVQRQAQPDRFC